MNKIKKKKRKKVVLGILLAYVIVVAAVYFGGVFYYSKHFFSGSVINGIDATGKTADEVEELIADGISEYTLNLTERGDGKERIVASQIGLKYIDDGKIAKLKKEQNAFAWIFSFTNKKAYTMSATTTYDKDKLNSVIDSLECFQEDKITAPEDAKLTETDAGYEITPETQGNTLDKEKAVQLITQAVEQGGTEISFEDEDCYLKPAVYSDNEKLIAQRDQMNAYLKVTITYDFSDRKEVVDKNVIKTFLTTDESGTVSLDESKVKAYVKELGKKYDTFGLSREFKTSLGTTVQLKGGDYGWVISKDKETAALIEAIKSGESQTREPIYIYSGKCRDTNDIGGTFVEVSIENQRMWAYKDGNLIVDTPIVTGSVAKGYDTPAGGVWAIDAKKRDTFLEGQGYSSPVSYWMPFNGGVGIHDATWRSDFGGEIYKTGGSHGCVNTPFDNAEKIYNNVEIGTPVVVW